MYLAEIVRPFPVRPVTQAYVGRDGRFGATHPAHDRTERGPSVFARHRGPGGFLPRVAAVELIGRMQLRELYTAEDRELVGNLRLHRHQLADMHPRHIGLDRSELAAVLDGSVWFEIIHVEVGRSATQKDHDHGFLTRLARPRRFGSQAENIA